MCVPTPTALQPVRVDIEHSLSGMPAVLADGL